MPKNLSKNGFNWCHVNICLFFIDLKAYSTKSSYIIHNFPTILNLNQTFLKLNWFICNYCSDRFSLFIDMSCEEHDYFNFISKDKADIFVQAMATVQQYHCTHSHYNLMMLDMWIAKWESPQK
jgi:hypothetical protein